MYIYIYICRYIYIFIFLYVKFVCHVQKCQNNYQKQYIYFFNELYILDSSKPKYILYIYAYITYMYNII